MNAVHRRGLAVAAALLLIVGGSVAWLQWRRSQPLQLTLRFHPVVGAEALVLDEARYANPGGPGRFAVRDFRLFVSNVRLLGDAVEHAEPDSYHLLRFDGAEPSFSITLHGVPRGDYGRIAFGIGVDPAANGSVAMRGDLDPNGRMAWTWDVGYKFVLMEGTLEMDGTRRPLVYHVGFDENYTELDFALDGDRLSGREARLDFRVDLLQLFGGSPRVDMSALPSVKFDRADATRLAKNFEKLIAPM